MIAYERLAHVVEDGHRGDAVGGQLDVDRRGRAARKEMVERRLDRERLGES